MPITINCPNCSRALRVPDELLGQRVKCPACATVLTASAGGSVEPEAPFHQEEEVVPRRRPAPPPEEEHVEEEPRARQRRPAPPPEEEYEEEPAREEEDGEERPPRQRLSSDYSINAGEWFEYAKIHYSSVLGPMIGYMLIVMVIGIAISVIPIVGPIARIFIDPPLQAGFTIVALAQLKGKRWSFGDFFSGFQWYGAIIGNFFLIFLMVLGCSIPFLIVLVIALSTHKDELLIGAIIFGVCIVLPPTIYLLVRATFFNIPLIIDRKLGPIEAIQGSWTLSRGHFWGLFGMALLLGLINMGGALLCGIGLLFTVPFVFLALNAGYLLIAGTRPPRRSLFGRPRRRPDEAFEAED